MHPDSRVEGSCSPAYSVWKVLLPRGFKVGLGLSQRFRLFPKPVQAVEQLRM
jgi:hypothetical protein